jgi:hypothetical protein
VRDRQSCVSAARQGAVWGVHMYKHKGVYVCVCAVDVGYIAQIARCNRPRELVRGGAGEKKKAYLMNAHLLSQKKKDFRYRCIHK